MNNYSVGSLFAGVGGVCQAFKNASFSVIWANEFDKKACITYRLNHTDTLLFDQDVQSLNTKKLSPIDVLTAGFPCQPFSQAGHGKGFDDERGKLFFEVIRFLDDLQPQAYFLENVKTLATHDNRKTFAIIRDKLKEVGYSFIPFILNAAEHTDIPQGRERIYIVGFKNEAEYSFEKPIKENIKLNSSIFAPFSSSFVIPKKEIKPRREIHSFLDKTTVLESDLYNNLSNPIHLKIQEAVINAQVVYQYRRYYVRANKSAVCPTLTANMGGGGHNIPIILDDSIPRRLTPKECFNLQGFPNKFLLPSNISRVSLYKQAGNSVVVPMVEKIAKEIGKVLNENNHCSSKFK
ncbi:MAG: DNA (cytosine-5-)-methyltransferase [Sulfurospirillum cavolei]|nr:DNA (cytosine-5-)-methyltransferase [Sulfurospirillum cavolei]